MRPCNLVQMSVACEKERFTVNVHIFMATIMFTSADMRHIATYTAAIGSMPFSL